MSAHAILTLPIMPLRVQSRPGDIELGNMHHAATADVETAQTSIRDTPPYSIGVPTICCLLFALFFHIVLILAAILTVRSHPPDKYIAGNFAHHIIAVDVFVFICTFMAFVVVRPFQRSPLAVPTS
jgi:hypothetical protein